ncbi:CDP-diacylglycerol-serine O-phosphatidyltransferase [Coemansia erecta]|nr:CDP-diacylglycerol-serine O-phosphatidyltransferase [Coemansia sp. RSA 2618]KAJ2829441.1 CDP-diacylglycerol-serine O-phosphatidyltransferase [Coemansia erecta]
MPTQPKRKHSDPQPQLPTRFSMVRSFQLADFVTLGNGVCGCLSLMFAMKALLTQNTDFLFTSFWCIPLGVVFDVLDGRVARWRGSSSLLGQELDSLADFCSFGLAPAVLGFACGFQKMLDLVVLTYFVCCALARLARFNATVASLPRDQNGKVAYFEGTPVPTTLVIVGVLAYGVYCGRFWRFANPVYRHEGPFAMSFDQAFTPEYVWGGELAIFPGYELHPLVLMYGVSGTLMISRRLRIPKL